MVNLKLNYQLKKNFKENHKIAQDNVHVENDKIVEYPVTISEDGEYAIFETDHFSIYTLAEATKNPKTGDNIMIYVATLMLSSSYLLTRKLRKN